MASETKVGLLAGLAFIVVFAVILANRGQVDPLLSQKPLSTERHVILGEQSVPKDHYQARKTSVELPKEGFQPNHAVKARTDHSPDPDQRILGERATHRPQPAKKTLPGTRNITFANQELSPQIAIANNQPRPQTRFQEIQPKTQIQSPVSDTQAVAAKQPLANPLTLQQQLPSQLEKPKVAGTKYVVLAGDTLYGIAGKHYAKGGGNAVRAIVKANGDTLPNPDKLRVGTVLVLPKLSRNIKSKANPAASARNNQQKQEPKRKTNTDQGFDWYQVKKGDRYASIAREKLGDVKRWREVFELNKDKFPNPDRIRDGVLIKIPKSKGGKKG